MEMEQEVPLTPEQMLEDKRHAREVAARTEQTQTLAIAGSTVFALLSAIVLASYATGVWQHILIGIGAAAIAVAFWYTLVTYRERQLLAKDVVRIRRQRATRVQEELPPARTKKTGAGFYFMWSLVILTPVVFIALATFLMGLAGLAPWGLLSSVLAVGLFWTVFAHKRLRVEVRGNKFDVYQNEYTGELTFHLVGSSWRPLFSKFIRWFPTERQSHEYKASGVETADGQNVDATLRVVWTDLPCARRQLNSDTHVRETLESVSKGAFTQFVEGHHWTDIKIGRTAIESVVSDALEDHHEISRLGIEPGFVIEKMTLSGDAEKVDLTASRIAKIRDEYLNALAGRGIAIEERHFDEALRRAQLTVLGDKSGIRDYGSGRSSRPNLFISE